MIPALVVDAAAAARLTRLLAVDSFPPIRRARDRILDKYPPPGSVLTADDGWACAESVSGAGRVRCRRGSVQVDGVRVTTPGRADVYTEEGHPIGYLVTCQHCTGVWVAAAVVAARAVLGRRWDPIARVLAIAGVVSYLADRQTT